MNMERADRFSDASLSCVHLKPSFRCFFYYLTNSITTVSNKRITRNNSFSRSLIIIPPFIQSNPIFRKEKHPTTLYLLFEKKLFFSNKIRNLSNFFIKNNV